MSPTTPETYKKRRITDDKGRSGGIKRIRQKSLERRPSPAKKLARIEVSDKSLSRESIRPSSISWIPLLKRIDCIRRFWKKKQGHPFSFPLREIRDLSSHADAAMKTLFDLDYKIEVERIHIENKILFRCGCKWYATQIKWVYGYIDKSETEAKLSAARAALNVILGDEEYTALARFSESINFRDMSLDQQSKALLLEDSDNLLANEHEQSDKKLNSTGFKKYDSKTFSSLTRREKENIIANYWSKYFHMSKSSKEQQVFPIIFQLMGFRKIDVNAAEAFKKLFSVSEQKKETCVSFKLHCKKQDSSGKTKLTFTYNCWWLTGDIEHDVSAEDHSEYSAKNQVATKALKQVLGEEQFYELVHMSQPFFWKDMDVNRIRERIERGRKNETRAVTEAESFVTAMSNDIAYSEAEISDLAVSAAINLNNQPRPSNIQRLIKLKDVVALEEYLTGKNQQEPDYTFSDAYHVNCKIRNHGFESLWHDEIGAKSLAAMQAIEFLWGSKFDEEIDDVDLTDKSCRKKTV